MPLMSRWEVAPWDGVVPKSKGLGRYSSLGTLIRNTGQVRAGRLRSEVGAVKRPEVAERCSLRSGLLVGWAAVATYEPKAAYQAATDSVVPVTRSSPHTSRHN